jgi:hypothetical protein
MSTCPKILKLGGCLAIHLKSSLSQSPTPLGSNFDLFKIQPKFGQTSHSFLSFSLNLSHSLANRPSDPSLGQAPLFLPSAL